MEVVPTLLGEKTRLRPVEEGDMPLFLRWFNYPEVRHWLFSSERPLHTLESLLTEFERLRNDDSERDWLIETLDGRPIGNAGLAKIQRPHLVADLFISIGETDCWSQGYGADAIGLVLREAFENFEFRRVQLFADSDNARGLRCYEKCGFVREGLLREHRLRHGEPLDVVVMGVLRSEWEARQ